MPLHYNTNTNTCFYTCIKYNREKGPKMDICRGSWTAHITMGLTDVMSGCVLTSHITLIKGQLYDSTIITITNCYYLSWLLTTSVTAGIKQSHDSEDPSTCKSQTLDSYNVMINSCNKLSQMVCAPNVALFMQFLRNTRAAGSLLTNYWPHP